MTDMALQLRTRTTRSNPSRADCLTQGDRRTSQLRNRWKNGSCSTTQCSPTTRSASCRTTTRCVSVASILSLHILTRRSQVAKTRRIITSPALLESTSLVFAYGLDLFFTRVAPSNTFDVLSESFNKAQLVVTIAGLAFAIVVVKPIVARKRLRERWYD